MKDGEREWRRDRPRTFHVKTYQYLENPYGIRESFI
jgi:hypothetical protein